MKENRGIWGLGCRDYKIRWQIDISISGYAFFEISETKKRPPAKLA